MEEKNYIIKTKYGYFMGYDDDHDPIYNSRRENAKLLKHSTAMNMAARWNHLDPFILKG